MFDNDPVLFIQTVRALVPEEKIALKKHCLLRMRQRSIFMFEIVEAFSHPTLVEYYKDDFPFPSALLLGFTKNGRPLHAVVALNFNYDILWFIILYEPDRKNWDAKFMMRRI